MRGDAWAAASVVSLILVGFGLAILQSRARVATLEASLESRPVVTVTVPQEIDLAEPWRLVCRPAQGWDLARAGGR